MSAPVDVLLEVGLNVDVKRGIDYYTENMIRGLAEADSRNRYTVFSYFFRDFARKRARLHVPARPNFTGLFRRFPDSLVESLDVGRGWPIVEKALLRGRSFDVYHMLSSGRLPHISGARTVVTFYDLMEETKPLTGEPDPGRRIASPRTYDRARRADRIVATGETTKKNLVRFYGLPPEKIEVIPTGVDLSLFRPVEDRAERERVRARYGLPARFLMAIGPYAPEWRTNSDSILRAYAALCRDGRAGDCRFVFVGAVNAYVRKMLELAAELGIRERVSAAGYAAIEDLPAVYSLSEGVVHPTSVEGFGYGMEPLACGTPFVTSDLPGVLESVGGVALTVPPRDDAALERALARLLNEPALRREMREKGLVRAAGYDYPAVAARLVSLYERLAACGEARA